MTIAPSIHQIVVEVPDGPTALALEHRLAHLCPVSMSVDEHWTVSIPAVHDPAEVETAVRLWLAEIGANTARIRIDGVAHTVQRATRRHLSTNARFIG